MDDYEIVAVCHTHLPSIYLLLILKELILYILKNSLAVKKGVALNGQCEKVVKSKGPAKK